MVIVIVLVPGLISVRTCNLDWGSSGEIPSSKRASDGNCNCVSGLVSVGTFNSEWGCNGEIPM